ncbi:MAG: trigger factor [Clostridia bacterium]|nr:trigger factor [Clostridia bacterium]
MSVKVEKTENKNELKLEFTVEAKKFDEAMKTVFTKNAKYFNIPGFRKGKAPMAIVEKFYGTEIFYEDAFNEVVPSVYDEAIKAEKLEVVSKPSIDVVQIGKGKDLVFTAVVQTKPEVKLGKYKGITLEKTTYKVTDEAVDNEINRMAERNARMVSVTDRAAKKGDVTVIDFEGSVDGVKFEGGTAENHELELGSGSFIPGFEDQVIGMKIDEVKDVKVKFPEEYFSKELAGKDAVFKVTVHEIKNKELPKIDDEFAKDVSEFDTLAELKADTKKKLQDEQDNKAKSELEENAVKAVSDDSEVEIPSGMIELEIEGMAEDMNRRLSYQGVTFEQYLQMIGKTMEDFKNDNQEAAKTSSKMKLVLEAVYNDAKLNVEDKEVTDKLEELATMYGRDIEDLKKNEELVERVTESFKSEKAINYIIDNAKIKEVAEKKEEKAEKTTTKKSTTKASETKSEKADSKEEKTKKEPAKKTTTKKSTKKSE